MAPDSAVAPGTGSDHEVMAALDGDRLVIADLADDDAWLSIAADEAPPIPELR